MWSLDFQYGITMEAVRSWKISGPTPGLLSEALFLNKIPRWPVCRLKFEKPCAEIFAHYGKSCGSNPLLGSEVTMSVCFLTLSTLEIMCSNKASPGGSGGKESTCQCRKCGFDPWVGKMPWRRKWQPTPVFLAGEFHGQISLVGYSLWGHKESTMISDFHFSRSTT